MNVSKLQIFYLLMILGSGILCSSLAYSASQERIVPRDRAEVTYSYAPLVRQSAPAVVNIYARKLVRQRLQSPLFNDQFFRRFFGDMLPPGAMRERVESSLGSGVIVREDGYIVTNNHVIAGADEVTVVLADRREFDADLILADERTDLAVLRIDAAGKSLPYLDLMDSDDLEVGDIILAIGNPFGIGQTVTEGIVSALARTQLGAANYGYFIQTDAAINPGNSGGAMISLSGQLAGINTAIFSKSGGSVGIGFAVPANMVRVVIDSALRDGKILRPWLGISGQAVTADIAAAQGLDRPGGVLVNSVYPGGPGEKSGVRVGDIIRKFGRHDVLDPEGLAFRVATRPHNSEASLQIARGKIVFDTAVTLLALPEDPPRDLSWIEGKGPLAGAQLGNLSPAFAEELGLDPMKTGVVVVEIAPNSPARSIRLKPGDILLRINSSQISRVEDAKAMSNQTRERWRLSIKRGDRVLNVVIRR